MTRRTVAGVLAAAVAAGAVGATPAQASVTAAPALTASTVVTHRVRTGNCDVSKPKRITTVKVTGLKVKAIAKGTTYRGTRKAGKAVVRLRSAGAPFSNFEVRFTSTTSKRAASATFVC